MLQQSSVTVADLSDVRVFDNPADRRAHPRIPVTKLRGARVRIPHRPAVSLVDLSSGGALLELPFPVQPESRFAVQLLTPVEQMEVPFQLLRCYVAELRGGVTYHAAGAFDSLLNLQALAARASSAAQRLITTLDVLHRGAHAAAGQSRGAAEFNERLSGVLVALRRGDSLDLVALKVRAHLTQKYSSLAIIPGQLPNREPLTSVECFGLTFKSRYVLSAQDRRYLKANAQLLSMIDDCRREMRDEEHQPFHATEVIRGAAEWLSARSEPSADASLANVTSLLRAPLPVRSLFNFNR